MWSHEHSVDADVTPAQVWACYANTALWPAFDPGLERMTLAGPFAAGTRGRLVPREGDPRGRAPVPFLLVRAQPERGFTTESEIPGAVTLRFVHRLAEVPGGTRITHGVEIAGPAADSLGPAIGPVLTAVIPGIVETLVRVAAAQAA
ncbi:SRPBCC family protein [Streptacidiphilus cavernicola]|uniref:SRPBCC family protein n=1 Tax=Streptacidiphilus cavernicola TaxID=3342716 RepID=A0ABV6VRB5_9ACTN